MDPDIQFGPVEESSPDVAVRPDQDSQYLTVECGQVGKDDLPVFVDLDVMREMEAHARSNTEVELGGVMLGGQYVDHQGEPFIMVTDSLRARHYEATKGSFKFTRDTWSQITRERAQLATDIQMVGWYHTHPNWGVFLSGMDLFICDNFFNRPLDVALVIDPCSRERGWFQWDGKTTKKRSTGGFFLIANRYRQADLEHYSRLYTNRCSTTSDSYCGSQINSDGQDLNKGTFSTDNLMVNRMDVRRPIFELAVVCVLIVQLVMAFWIGWQVLELSSEPKGDGTQPSSDLRAERDVMLAREKAYSEILEKVVSRQTGQPGIVGEVLQLKEQERLLLANLEGQLARVKQVSQEKEALNEQLAMAMRRTSILEQEVAGLNEKNQHFDREIRELRDSGQAADKNARDVAALGELGWGQKLWRASNYWGAALFFLLGGIVGCFCARQILRPSQPEPTQPVETPEQVNFEKELAQDEFVPEEKQPSLTSLK